MTPLLYAYRKTDKTWIQSVEWNDRMSEAPPRASKTTLAGQTEKQINTEDMESVKPAAAADLLVEAVNP
ncbi:hypothetical protein V6N11_055107 [Hibiscus sabdariffa]|uniref:Uncharacterized protein n=1 Tax=Hibiscus sabdariffa TaxID=183260 RepID=A0ABR1ZQS0_9ROSI